MGPWAVNRINMVARHNNFYCLYGQFCPRGRAKIKRLTLCKTPTQDNRPGHNTGNSVPYSKGKSPSTPQGGDQSLVTVPGNLILHNAV